MIRKALVKMHLMTHDVHPTNMALCLWLHAGKHSYMLSCFIKSLWYYCIKSCVLSGVQYYECDLLSEWWLSPSDAAFIFQLNLIFTIKHQFDCPQRKAIGSLSLLQAFHHLYHAIYIFFSQRVSWPNLYLYLFRVKICDLLIKITLI